MSIKEQMTRQRIRSFLRIQIKEVRKVSATQSAIALQSLISRCNKLFVTRKRSGDRPEFTLRRDFDTDLTQWIKRNPYLYRALARH